MDLDELERLARAATPGPWSNLSINGDPIESVWLEDGSVVATWSIGEPRFEFHAPQSRADAAFIAAANPAAVLELVARLRAAEREAAILKKNDQDASDMRYSSMIDRDLEMQKILDGMKARAEKAEAIVRDLAAKEPNWGGHCLMCNAPRSWPALDKEPHAPDCLHRRAVEATR